MNKRHMPVQKLVALFMGVFLSLVVSLPVFAAPSDYGYAPGQPVTGKEITGNITLPMVCCPEDHCSSVSEQMNLVCKAIYYNDENGKTPIATISGYPHGVVDKARTGVCACPCSCLIGSMMVMLENGETKRADELVEGDMIMVMSGSGLQGVPIYLVTRSSVTNHKVQKVTLNDGSSLTASNNHTVVNEYDQLVTLESVAVGSKLRRYDDKLVEVITNGKIVKESVDLINVMVNINSTLPLHHVYVTNNLLSGDMLAQLTHDATGEDINLLRGKIDLSNVPPKKIRGDNLHEKP